MLISQFFILSPRGDTIITRECWNSNGHYFFVHFVIFSARNLFKFIIFLLFLLEFFLSVRNDEDTIKGTSEIFFRKVRFWEGRKQAPPLFSIDGINFAFIKKSGLFFVITSSKNMSPTGAIDLLNQMAKVRPCTSFSFGIFFFLTMVPFVVSKGHGQT